MASPLRDLFRRLWRTDRMLTGYGSAMLLVFLVSAALIFLDPRTIAGAPAWLKPAKFAISTAIYSLTLAWIFTYLPEWPRLRRALALVTTVVFLIEIPVIDLQAWRGTTSHFNVSTPLDATLFAIMGIAILIQTVASAVLVVALWRQRFADGPMGWALRAGMTITVVGALAGGLMTRPTRAQLADARAGHRMTTAGAHTVGAPDGEPGLPGTGWSREHGDLRVPHFVGLHAVQALALFVVFVARRFGPSAARVVQVAAASYAALFAILLWQALRAESIVAPGSTTLAALGGWGAATLIGMWAVRTETSTGNRSTALAS